MIETNSIFFYNLEVKTKPQPIFSYAKSQMLAIFENVYQKLIVLNVTYYNNSHISFLDAISYNELQYFVKQNQIHYGKHLQYHTPCTQMCTRNFQLVD